MQALMLVKVNILNKDLGTWGVIRWGLATPPDYKQPFLIWWGMNSLG